MNACHPQRRRRGQPIWGSENRTSEWEVKLKTKLTDEAGFNINHCEVERSINHLGIGFIGTNVKTPEAHDHYFRTQKGRECRRKKKK